MPPRDGNGNYSLGAGNPVVTATTISSTVQNNTMNDVAAALTASIASDGQTTPSADLKMGTFKHKNVGNATSRISTNANYASAADVQDGSITHLTGPAGTNTITASAPLGLAAYATGQVFNFTPAVTNTGPTTLNINSIGAKNIFSNGQACGGNELISGMPVEVLYDGTQFNILAGNLAFVDTYFRIKGSVDATKQVRFEVDGLTTATTRLITLADADLNLSSQTQNKVFASPNGSTGAPAFRALVPADLSLTPITASLGADVNLSNTANFFDGPSVAQGSTGTWFASGVVSVSDSAGSANFQAKLWDGTTVIASAICTSNAAGGTLSMALSGYLASPAGNLRISVKDSTSVNGKIVFNGSGTSKDATISAIRIA